MEDMKVYRLYIIKDRIELSQFNVTNIELKTRSVYCKHRSFYLYAFNSIHRDCEIIFLDKKMITPYFERLKSYLLRKIDNEITEAKNRYENVKKWNGNGYENLCNIIQL